MSKPIFVYTIYIASTPVFKALTDHGVLRARLGMKRRLPLHHDQCQQASGSSQGSLG